MVQPLDGLRVKPRGGGVQPLDGLRVRPQRPRYASSGDSPDDPLNEQGVTEGERFQINNVGLGPQSIVNWLQKQGYEAQDLGGDEYAVRKPGDPKWKRVDPHGAGDWWKDLTLDAGDEYTSLLATGKGAGIGAGVGSPTGVGAIPGALVGAGIGAAGAEAARRTAGEAAGFHEPMAEHLKGVGKEAAWGAAGEVGGRALGYVAGKVLGKGKLSEGLQRPLMREHAKDALGKEVTAEQAARADLRETGLELEPYRDSLMDARAGTAAAGVERQEAAMEMRAQMRERVKNATGSAEEAIARGKAEAKGMVFEPSNTTSQTSQTVKEHVLRGRQRLDVPSEIARPDWGITADAIKRNPEVGAILRKHFGEEFVPVADDLSKAGSHAMMQREARLSQLIAERGPEWTESASKGFISDIAAYMIGHPEFRAKIDPNLLDALAGGASGRVTSDGATKVMEVLTSKLSGRNVTPRLQEAQTAFEQAQLQQKLANSELLNSSAARSKRVKEQVLRRQMAKTSRARSEHSKLSPKTPYADFGSTWLGGRIIPPVVTKPAEWAGRRAAYGAGKAVEKAPKLLTPARLSGAGQAATMPYRRKSDERSEFVRSRIMRRR